MSSKGNLYCQRRKKIAVVFPKDSESVFNNSKTTFGGATVQLYNYAQEIAKYHDVYCLIPETYLPDRELFPNFNFVFTFSKKDNYFKRIIKFHLAIRSVNPDVVIQRGLTRVSTFLGFYCRLFMIKYIFMFAHDREAKGRFQRSNRVNIFYPFLLFFARYLVVQNDSQLNNLPSFFGKKTIKIRNAYSIVSEDLCGKEGVLWVSRLEPWKRPELCIEAAIRNPDISFTMIAPADSQNTEYAAKIYKMAGNIRNIKIIDFVCFSEIDNYFKKARVFLNTSLEEGFPNTFIQACKNRTPIVSLNVNPDNFITKFSTGVFCSDDIEIMDSSLILLLTDDSCFSRCSDSAYDYVSRYHSIEINAGRLTKLILST
ncbi:MAG: glycosyltransferase family 4 protein [Spirochaetes bacterium]|nr:glycosyltransferase family 4 protein [Spirochaetota bacterium]